MAKYDKYTKEQLLEVIEKLENQKKFGLVWEEKTEEVTEQCKTNFPVLQEIPDRVITGNDPQSPTHLIIEGDNYLSLSVLNVTHKGKIDVIYIDPPYNTGNKDFKYNDSFVDKEDSFRHSKWLSFMEKRLKLAKILLSDSGVIFISIDDNEQAHLKLLCDEVFGENNFISLNVIETANGVFGTRASQTKRTFVKVKDYVLVYAKSKIEIYRDFQPLFMPTNDRFDAHYSIMLDENINRKSFVSFLKENEETKKIFEKYSLKISLENVSKLMQIDTYFNDIIVNKLANKIYQDVDFSLNIPDEIDEQIKNGNVVKFKNYLIFRTNDGNGNIRQFLSFKESLKITDDYIPEYRRAVAIGDLWEGFDNDMKNVTKEGNVNFSNGKKPVRLIKQLIKWNNVNNATILDFFAGSGTTGHAVLELNKEDGGNRQFILCTNNENEICEKVTYPRIKKVTEGYANKAAIPANIRYFKTDFIKQSEDTDENRVRLAERCHELLQIKESCYENQETSVENLTLWRSANKLLAVIFDRYDKTPDAEYINAINLVNQKNLKNQGSDIDDIVVYRFSIDGNLDMDISTLPNARLEAIPEEILKTFNQILKTKKKKK